jgi:hypothetical protein
MLNLLPLTGFLRAAVCLHRIQFNKGEISPQEEDILQHRNKEKKNNRLCLKYFSTTISQKWVSKHAEHTNLKGSSGEQDNIKVSSRKKGHNWICLV